MFPEPLDEHLGIFDIGKTAATLLSTDALAKVDASLISPLLTFNPAFTLLIA